MTILVDSREQRPFNFEHERYDVQIQPGALTVGDYSLAGLQDKVAVERKELSDLVQCLGRERERLDWAVSRESFYDHTTRVFFCDRAFKIPNPQVRIETDNFRATIDELMVQS